MRLFFGSVYIIIHVLVSAQAPRNADEADWFETIEENVTVPRFAKIIGGTLAVPIEFPAIAALAMRRRHEISECTGTVLNSRFVLTAGHCICNALAITIYIGCTDLYNCREYKQGSGILHPRYTVVGNYTYNDIGLVRSSRRFSTTAHALLSTSTSYYQGCLVVGYGYTSENLQEVNSKLYKLHVFHVIPCTYFFPPILVNHMIGTMVCSLVEDNRRYNFGDSGGPLLCEKTQVGVTSQLISFTTSSKQGLKNVTVMSWVPVGLYVEWIQQTMSCSSSPSSKFLFVELFLFIEKFVI